MHPLGERQLDVRRPAGTGDADNVADPARTMEFAPHERHERLQVRNQRTRRKKRNVDRRQEADHPGLTGPGAEDQTAGLGDSIINGGDPQIRHGHPGQPLRFRDLLGYLPTFHPCPGERGAYAKPFQEPVPPQYTLPDAAGAGKGEQPLNRLASTANAMALTAHQAQFGKKQFDELTSIRGWARPRRRLRPGLNRLS